MLASEKTVPICGLSIGVPGALKPGGPGREKLLRGCPPGRVKDLLLPIS